MLSSARQEVLEKTAQLCRNWYPSLRTGSPLQLTSRRFRTRHREVSNDTLTLRNDVDGSRLDSILSRLLDCERDALEEMAALSSKFNEALQLMHADLLANIQRQMSDCYNVSNFPDSAITHLERSWLAVKRELNRFVAGIRTKKFDSQVHTYIPCKRVND
jgi:hypothetical protein